MSVISLLFAAFYSSVMLRVGLIE